LGGVLMAILDKFGDRVRELRKGQGISQEKLALKIEMDRTYLASVEAGKRNISLSNIEKIAKGLGVEISDLFIDV
jgi:transcriptional regulator with XRE-family HTH domain